MPVVDPGLLGTLLLIAALVVALAAVWYVGRRQRGGRPSVGGPHAMERDDSIGYFRDFSATQSAPGVHEEDRATRWGEPRSPSR